MQNKKVVLISIIGLLLVFIGGIYAYKSSESSKYEKLSKEQASLYKRDYSWVEGSKDAKVQLVEFFDPACATCAQFHYYVKDMMKKYDGKIQHVIRYAPFHQNSNYAVMMLEGARAQGKYMETLEFMFDNQKYWIDGHTVNPKKLWSMLPQVGLDMQKLANSMNDPKLENIVKQDLADADALGATKTPSFFVNGKPLQNFGLEPLVELIESEL